MADTVRYFMEEMVPELEDIEAKGYFTKPEIREIVRQREKFEYALKRKTPTKADFLRYVEYEKNLDEVMKLRKAAKGIQSNIGKGELGCIKRCHVVYDRATKKFRGDLRIWLSWLEFCKASNSARQMSKVVTKALQLHPKDAGLWMYAAAWEFEKNKNTAGARSLMLQGLRMCKKSESLWLEYLKMELIYAQKLRARQAVLGILKKGRKKARIEPQPVNPSPEDDDELVETAKEDLTSLEEVLHGSVARIVLKNALLSIPDSLSFRGSILEVLIGMPLPGTEILVDDLYADLQARFGDCEEAWDMRARRAFGTFAPASDPTSVTANNFAAAVATYEESIAVVSSSRMYDLYAAFLLDQIGWEVPGSEEGAMPEFAGAALKRKNKKAAQMCMRLYQRAAKKGTLSESAALTWPKVALACRNVHEALRAAVDGPSAHPQSMALWTQAIILCKQQLHLQNGAARGKLVEAVEAIVLKAIASVNHQESEQLWPLAFQTFEDLSIELGPLMRSFKQCVIKSGKGPLTGGLGEAAASILLLIRNKNGIVAWREAYQALLRLPPAGGDMYHAVIEAELEEREEQLSSPDLRALFEAALEAYGKEDTALWVKYAQFEQQLGQGSGKLYWRATKQLADPSEFITRMSKGSNA